MKEHIISVKYSLFGKYDYIDANPENVSKLYNTFGTDGFMPNIVTLLKIIQPQNTVEQRLRPQLINKKDNCVITILPERIDVEFTNGASTDNIIRYLSEIINMFDLKINRIALNTSTGVADLSNNDINNYNMKLTAPTNYDGENDLIEYTSRRVSRKHIDCINELINVGRNITGITEMIDGKLVISRIQVDTDINTLAESVKERFNVDSCRKFFDVAMDINNDVIGKILVMNDES